MSQKTAAIVRFLDDRARHVDSDDFSIINLERLLKQFYVPESERSSPNERIQQVDLDGINTLVSYERSNRPSIPRTALHVATLLADQNAVSVLLRYGADINKPDHNGESPLLSAVNDRNVQMIEFLASSGANIHQSPSKDIFTTPLSAALSLDAQADLAAPSSTRSQSQTQTDILYTALLTGTARALTQWHALLLGPLRQALGQASIREGGVSPAPAAPPLPCGCASVCVCAACALIADFAVDMDNSSADSINNSNTPMTAWQRTLATASTASTPLATATTISTTSAPLVDASWLLLAPSAGPVLPMDLEHLGSGLDMGIDVDAGDVDMDMGTGDGGGDKGIGRAPGLVDLWADEDLDAAAAHGTHVATDVGVERASVVEPEAGDALTQLLKAVVLTRLRETANDLDNTVSATSTSTLTAAAGSAPNSTAPADIEAFYRALASEPEAEGGWLEQWAAEEEDLEEDASVAYAGSDDGSVDGGDSSIPLPLSLGDDELRIVPTRRPISRPAPTAQPPQVEAESDDDELVTSSHVEDDDFRNDFANMQRHAPAPSQPSGTRQLVTSGCGGEEMNSHNIAIEKDIKPVAGSLWDQMERGEYNDSDK